MTETTLPSLADMARSVAAGHVTSVQLVTDHLDRIETFNPALNAFVGTDAEGALIQAERLDRERAEGRLRGPLHGVPLAHKDMFHEAGKPCEYGAALMKGHVASVTGPLIERLNAAGALSLGRLHMSEFAMGPTGHNAHLGRCRNPWDTRYITGGSSSGSGAAVAAGLCAGALGSDTGGSVRLPAAICGTVGLKPTQGRLPQTGMMALSESLDCPGVLARSAEDTALLFGTLVRDGIDYTAGLAQGVDGLVFGRPTSWYYDDLDPEIASCLDVLSAKLSASGARFVEVEIPDHADMGDLANIVFTPEAAALHADLMRDQADGYGPQVLARLAQGLAISAVQYRQALQLRAVHARQMCHAFERCDVILAPVLRQPVPTSAATDVGAGPEMARIIAGISELTRPLSYLGLPGLAVPVGRDRSGLPIAAQLIGKPLSEALLLRAGAACETDVGRRPPCAPTGGEPDDT